MASTRCILQQNSRDSLAPPPNFTFVDLDAQAFFDAVWKFHSITVSLAFEEASPHSAEAICPCDISGILLPLLRCLHSSPSILRICHYSGLDTEHSIRTLTEQWRTRTPGMSAGCWPIASLSWVCMISSLSQVCSQSWYSFLSSVMANKKQATTI